LDPSSPLENLKTDLHLGDGVPKTVQDTNPNGFGEGLPWGYALPIPQDGNDPLGRACQRRHPELGCQGVRTRHLSDDRHIARAVGKEKVDLSPALLVGPGLLRFQDPEPFHHLK
jgi:hypothetical protein